MFRLYESKKVVTDIVCTRNSKVGSVMVYMKIKVIDKCPVRMKVKNVEEVQFEREPYR